MTPIRVRTFYPADPAGVVPGGVDTFLRGILKHAPDDLWFSLVGMTTDTAARPIGRWTRCRSGNREYDFYPVVHHAAAGSRGRIPLSMRFTAATWRRLPLLRQGFDVFEFHRVEPGLIFLRDRRPKNAFFHQDMSVIRSTKSDIIWHRMPWVYFTLERQVAQTLSSMWCVREEGVTSLRQRYPQQAGSIRFVPTWVDPEVFSPVNRDRRETLRIAAAARYGIRAGSTWIISVGRLDGQKNPSLLLSAFARLMGWNVDATLLVVGDGVLRTDLERQVVDLGLSDRVRFLGLKAPELVADLLRVADVFALSSAYEGMPMAVLEALGSGLPVVTTDVGEVRQVVMPGVNGLISADHSEKEYAACLLQAFQHMERWRGSPAVQAVAPFQPARVLAPIFDNYRRLGRSRSTGGI